MKTFFHGYGLRETESWSCPHCKNYSTGGMDLAVAENRNRHLMVCPLKPPNAILSGTVVSRNHRTNGVFHHIVLDGYPRTIEWIVRGGDFQPGDRVKVTVEKE